MRIALIIVASSISASALAQNSNTHCQMIGNTWTCNTQQQPDVWGDFRRQIDQQNNQAEIMRRNAEMIRNNSKANERSAITEIWARCRKRWNEALEARDFELADALVKGCPAAPE